MTAIPVAIRVSRQRWLQLTLGIVCMAMIANLQYGWTLFVNPIDAKYHWGRAAIQVAFSIFVLTETWLVPVEGWFVDRYGPRIVVACGGNVAAASQGVAMCTVCACGWICRELTMLSRRRMILTSSASLMPGSRSGFEPVTISRKNS